MAHIVLNKPRTFSFKFASRRSAPVTIGVVLVAWSSLFWALSLSMPALDALGGAVAPPADLRATMAPLLLLAALLWLVMPTRRARFQLDDRGLTIHSRRALLWKTRHIAWHDIDRISLHRAPAIGKSVDIHLKTVAGETRPQRIRVLTTKSSEYLPKFLSAMDDFAHMGGFAMHGDLIDGHLAGSESWTVRRKPD